MASHGATQEFGYIWIDVPMYVASEMDTILDGYDAAIAGKANTSSLATVATTGAYSDLTGKPTIPAAQVNADWSASSGVAQILNKPTIPAAQIQSDWNQASTGALDYIKNKPTIPGTRSFNNSPGRSIVTGTGATGFQVSSTRDADVSYSCTMVTTATIAGNSSDVIVLEIAPTNSATPGDWVEIGRVTNGQALSLAITLQSVQTTSGPLVGVVPAGYYAKIRAITSGTVSNTFASGQEVSL